MMLLLKYDLLRTFVMLFLIVIATPMKSEAQCSDAGVCAIGGMPGSFEHHIAVAYNFGRSGKTDNLTFHALHVEAMFQILDDAYLIALLPLTRQSGPLGSASGIGDLSILWSHLVWIGGDAQISIQLGGKFATADVNAGRLPQAYQSGLGTNDIILGFSYSEEPWNAAVGYQLSRGRSENSLTRLQRGDDVLLRVGYSGDSGEYQYGFEVLGIKRLRESSVLDPTSSTGAFMLIPGSNQSQVNILGSALLPVDDSKNVRITAALPLLRRDVNVDGLTRSVTLSVGLLIAF